PAAPAPVVHPRHEESRDPAPAPTPSPEPEEISSIPADIPIPDLRPPAEESVSLPFEHEPEPTSPTEFRFIGELGGRFVLFEDEAGLVLLDARAARERILYEQLLRRIDREEV